MIENKLEMEAVTKLIREEIAKAFEVLADRFGSNMGAISDDAQYVAKEMRKGTTDEEDGDEEDELKYCPFCGSEPEENNRNRKEINTDCIDNCPMYGMTLTKQDWQRRTVVKETLKPCPFCGNTPVANSTGGMVDTCCDEDCPCNSMRFKRNDWELRMSE